MAFKKTLLLLKLTIQIYVREIHNRYVYWHQIKEWISKLLIVWIIIGLTLFFQNEVVTYSISIQEHFNITTTTNYIAKKTYNSSNFEVSKAIAIDWKILSALVTWTSDNDFSSGSMERVKPFSLPRFLLDQTTLEYILYQKFSGLSMHKFGLLQYDDLG